MSLVTPSKSVLLDLPTSLILLLHLHILSYSKCDSPEYSPKTLFASTRPLRERTKTMEDIVAFLIEKIEGKGKCKVVLGGTYPCLQPADTVSFRMNVTKYLESLRSSVVRPGSHASVTKVHQPSSKGNSGRPLSPSHKSKQPVAWWWSAIVVRKSLLEECSGDKFEKMLLALSTHALFVKIQHLPALQNMDPKSSDLVAILQSQPHEYSRLLFQAQILYKGQVQSVSRLNSRTRELITLKQCLATTPHQGDEMRIDTARLVAIQSSKRGSLLNAWRTALNGNHSVPSQYVTEDLLEWLLSIAGCSSEPENDNQSTDSESSPRDLPDDATSIITPTPSLPIVAAHHPRNIKKLMSLPKFTALDTAQSGEPESYIGGLSGGGGSTVMYSSAIQGLLDSSSGQKASLIEILESTTREGKRVQYNLQAKLAERITDSLRHKMGDAGPSGTFWTVNGIELDSQTLSLNDPKQQKFLSHFHIVATAEDDDRQIEARFESSVLALRNSLKPRIPTIQWDDEQTPGSPSPCDPSNVSVNSSTTRVIDEQPPGLEHTPVQSRPSTPIKSHVRSVKTRIMSEDWGTPGVATPKGPRRSTLLPSVLAAFARTPLAEDFIGDMSLPIATNDSFTGENGQWSEEDDIPFEGHSVTLRDILLNAGDEGERYNLIASSGMDDLHGEDPDEDEGEEWSRGNMFP